MEQEVPRPETPNACAGRACASGILRALLGPCTWRNVGSWALIIGAVLLLRWVAIDQFKIPSSSMEPTLQGNTKTRYSAFTNDRVSVDKFVYGLRFPLVGMRIPFTDYVIDYADERLWKGREPRRWDIVVFKTVDEKEPGMTLIKRVVGLPGERIHIADGKIYVNGTEAEPPPELKGILHYTTGPDDRNVREFIVQLARLSGPPAALDPRDPAALALILFLQRLHQTVAEDFSVEIGDAEAAPMIEGLDASAFAVARRLLERSHEKEGTFRYGVRTEDKYALVPEGCYLCLGDNSRDSRDGRCFGWVPNENILGRAFCIWWPISRWRDFTGFSRTWWGMGILYGVPALLIISEAIRYTRRRRARRIERSVGEN